MQLINQSHKIWGRCPSNPQEGLKWIERAGRVCYASEDKITENSALPFIKSLIVRGHLSVLEHSEIGFIKSLPNSYNGLDKEKYINYMDNVFVGNLRAWMEIIPNTNSDVLKDWLAGTFTIYPEIIPPPLRRYTVEFTTNRAMTHELVRHRPCSFSQQSQRYVRYGLTTPMQFIKPFDYDYWLAVVRKEFEWGLDHTESIYAFLLHADLKPQQARSILPNACATKIIVTADMKEWELIFGLRCGGGADPQMIDLMTPVRDEMLKLWEEEL